jgi:hypothetical protein
MCGAILRELSKFLAKITQNYGIKICDESKSELKIDKTD